MFLAQALRRRRETIRNRRVLDHAIAGAASPAMRDELIIAAQQSSIMR